MGRPGRGERSEHVGRPGRGDRSDHGGRPGRGDRSDPEGRPGRGDRSDPEGRPGRGRPESESSSEDEQLESREGSSRALTSGRRPPPSSKGRGDGKGKGRGRNDSSSSDEVVSSFAKFFWPHFLRVLSSRFPHVPLPTMPT